MKMMTKRFKTDENTFLFSLSWENHLIKSYAHRITMRPTRWTILLLQNRRSFASWNANTTTIDSSALIHLGAAE